MQTEQKPHQCAVCGVKSTSKCSDCRKVYYCGRDHQKAHWKTHKKECRIMDLECAVCGISESCAHLTLCPNCQMVAYCSKDHQMLNCRRGDCSKTNIRATISHSITSFVEDPILKSKYPQFQGDLRFQQLNQDLVDESNQRWLRHALELTFFLAEANVDWFQYNLGMIYETGYGVKQDIEKAVKWHRKAADQGQAQAQFKLGVCYEEGEGVPKDLSEAVKWYRKAADQGLADAQFNLGLCYQEGEGVPKDMSEASKLWHKAADQGDVDAQFNLGVFYGKGEGVPKDMSEAAKWYRKAADNGITEAIEALKI